MSMIPAIPDVVSIEKAEDYFKARGAWNGHRKLYGPDSLMIQWAFRTIAHAEPQRVA